MKHIKSAWEKVTALQKELDAVLPKRQAAGLAARDLEAEITLMITSDVSLLTPYSTKSANAGKIALAREKLADVLLDRKAADSLQNELGHRIKQATAEAWQLHAELEIKNILPKLLTVFALWQSSGGGSFEHGLLQPYFEKHRAEIPKIADRLKIEALR